MAPNNSALEVLIHMRAKYLLHMLTDVLAGLARNPDEPCRFADFQATGLIRICQALIAEIEGKAQVSAPASQVSVVSSLEVLMTTMVADESEWATAYCKILLKLLPLANLEQEKLVEGIRAMTVKLDVPPKFRYLLTGNGNSGPVKPELAAPALAAKGIKLVRLPGPLMLQPPRTSAGSATATPSTSRRRRHGMC